MSTEVQATLFCTMNRKDVMPMDSRGVSIITNVFNHALLSFKIQRQCRLNIIIPAFKGKGSVQECRNYRDIRVMSHTMKLFEKLIESLI